MSRVAVSKAGHLWRTVAGVFAVLGLLLWYWARYVVDLRSLERIVRARYPKVRQMSTRRLAKWLASGDPPPLLLDVRTAEEYAISHLPNARRLDPKTDRFDLGVPKDAPIVAYCAVGYRSSGIAQRLEKAGFKNVWNLEGSIFKWANEDRPLVRGDGSAAEKVHPFSRFWSKLVKPERRAKMPGSHA